ncbi:putative protein FAR1-RELATED SEQUENCE 10 [Medicago truncatula]|uniref:putative protein FAR1-RELATED SEQUENCE 10 n=1 Tax=Medicago truncatula TaxID=3880 RepID=UPI000D2F43B7|nr:putative protein FAR1-RELATED SEQUENCE 10 [Medicago truncatula]XP_039684334.1 putative protein FAR1-RELATED SEQUENCE 10 [Medicago truncatula]
MVDFQSDSTFDEEDLTQGLDSLSLFKDDSDREDVINENESEIPKETIEGSRNDGDNRCRFDESYVVNCLEDISSINFKELSSEDVRRYHFVDVAVAFTFYNWYASCHGFAARKSKVMRSKSGELTQQTLVCYRQGFTEKKSCSSSTRKRVPKARVRCGCEAKCRVHIDSKSGRWYMKFMNDVHNHALLDDQFTSMLPAHRKMAEFDIWRMRNMRQVGIKTSHIFGLFASEAGGYGRVGFRRHDMYNEQ